MKEIRVAESSGHQILDAEATRAVRSAAPFPPFPNHVTVARLNIKASFDYRIKAKK
jgi:TonB family protein